nr:MAG TPA: TraJ-like protein [Caudoviricetes sp.]
MLNFWGFMAIGAISAFRYFTVDSIASTILEIYKSRRD